jgi:hypothetical protein
LEQQVGEGIQQAYRSAKAALDQSAAQRGSSQATAAQKTKAPTAAEKQLRDRNAAALLTQTNPVTLSMNAGVEGFYWKAAGGTKARKNGDLTQSLLQVSAARQELRGLISQVDKVITPNSHPSLLSWRNDLEKAGDAIDKWLLQANRFAAGLDPNGQPTDRPILPKPPSFISSSAESNQTASQMAMQIEKARSAASVALKNNVPSSGTVEGPPTSASPGLAGARLDLANLQQTISARPELRKFLQRLSSDPKALSDFTQLARDPARLRQWATGAQTIQGGPPLPPEDDRKFLEMMINGVFGALFTAAGDAVNEAGGRDRKSLPDKLRSATVSLIVNAAVPSVSASRVDRFVANALSAGLETSLRQITGLDPSDPKAVVVNATLGGLLGLGLHEVSGYIMRSLGKMQRVPAGGSPLNRMASVDGGPDSIHSNPKGSDASKESHVSPKSTGEIQPEVHGGVTHTPEAIKMRQDFINEYGDSPLDALDPSQFAKAFGSVVDSKAW